MNSKIIKLALLLCIIVVMTCCKKIEQNDIIGRWILEEQASSIAKGLDVDENNLSFFDFYPDGSFRVENLPAKFCDPFTASMKEIKATGTWQLGDKQRRNVVILNFDKVSSSKGTNGNSFGTYFKISRGITEFTLFVWIGDPDSGDRIEYVKEK